MSLTRYVPPTIHCIFFVGTPVYAQSDETIVDLADINESSRPAASFGRAISNLEAKSQAARLALTALNAQKVEAEAELQDLTEHHQAVQQFSNSHQEYAGLTTRTEKLCWTWRLWRTFRWPGAKMRTGCPDGSTRVTSASGQAPGPDVIRTAQRQNLTRLINALRARFVRQSTDKPCSRWCVCLNLAEVISRRRLTA